jgi:hypothetical protein
MRFRSVGGVGMAVNEPLLATNCALHLIEASGRQLEMFNDWPQRQRGQIGQAADNDDGAEQEE